MTNTAPAGEPVGVAISGVVGTLDGAPGEGEQLPAPDGLVQPPPVAVASEAPHPFGLFTVAEQLHVTTADVDLDLAPGEYTPKSVDEVAALESAAGSTALIVRVKE